MKIYRKIYTTYMDSCYFNVSIEDAKAFDNGEIGLEELWEKYEDEEILETLEISSKEVNQEVEYENVGDIHEIELKQKQELRSKLIKTSKGH